MRRRIFTLLAAASLMLCVAVGVMCVRSYWVNDEWIRTSGNLQDFIFSVHGKVAWEREKFARSVMLRPAVMYRRRDAQNPSTAGLLGFAWESRSTPPNAYRIAFVPYWFLLAVIAPVPWGLWMLRRSRRDRLPGHCSACGYDLRATPDRCPECGALAGH